MTGVLDSHWHALDLMGRRNGGITMRPGRPLATVLLLASLAVAGCTARGAPTTGAATAADPTPTTTGPPAGAAAGTASPVSTSGSACAQPRAWGTGSRESAHSSTAPLYLVRVGQHDCYDRVVFDVNGPAAVGYSVRYTDVVREDGSGEPRPVAGAAALEVVIRAPALGADDQGHQPGKLLAGAGQDLYTAGRLAGWHSLREVRYAGSFEGQTTIALGVRARVPFRVLTLASTRDQVTRVVVDLAH